MPTTDDQVQFLYLVLTQGGATTIDWNPVCAALQLEKGAATKRWSRLKQAMGKGEKPTDSSLGFLWLVAKHSNREKSYDWEAIAKASDSTKGACSKRWSRLKLAFERGDAPPSTPGKAKAASATPKKTPAKRTYEDDAESTLTAAPKRRRAPAKRILDDADGDDEEDAPKATPKSKPRPKNSFRASDLEKEAADNSIIIKGEPAEDDGDVFIDAPEQPATGVTTEEGLPSSTFTEAFTNAREMADLLLNRDTGLTREYHDEIEGMLDVFDEKV